jgi:serine phosphatase RsbU (regulator of sigma subunit)
MHTDTLATAAVARLEPSRNGGGCRLRFANAGHPPPIVVGPDGSTTILGGPIGDLMLGVDCTVDRAESVLDVVPDSTVLLYTDGLIERRGRTIDEGLACLVEHVGELAGKPLEELCDALLERMLQSTPQDDVAIVAVRLSAVRHSEG